MNKKISMPRQGYFHQLYSRLTAFALIGSVVLSFCLSSALMLSGAAPAHSAPGSGATRVFQQIGPVLCWGGNLANPQSVILCVHGLGLHKGAFEDFGRRLNSEGIPVYALDVRGFGDWYLSGKDKIDLEASLEDIRQTLEFIKKQYPHASVFLLGESMGGAIALRATARYPGLVAGLISSVPSGDRFSGLGEDLKVGFHALLGGFSGRFNVGKHVVKHATKIGSSGEVNEALRLKWQNDPAGRTQFSPNELIAFQNFMNKNNETAAQVKETPVLILQGAKDEMVRGSGTWNVWEHLAVPSDRRTFAASTTASHLIFEYGQFSQNDISYVLSWMKKSLGPPPDQTVSDAPPVLPAKPQVPSKDEMLATAPNLGKTGNTYVPPEAAITKVASRPGLPLLSYWIELKREGKRYSCNNKTTFHSGDEIRIHVICSNNGYAYILMKQGTSGAHAVLFPEAHTGRNNVVTAGTDYALPSATWLKFDDRPGTERICLIFAVVPLDPDTNKYMNSHTVVVSADRTGCKDLCPTRAQLSWDDPDPLIMPSPTSEAANASLVKYSQPDDPKSVIAIDFDLEHRQ
jgi:acylglycerol lipase